MDWFTIHGHSRHWRRMSPSLEAQLGHTTVIRWGLYMCVRMRLKSSDLALGGK